MTDFLFRATTGHHSDCPCGFSRPHCRIGSPPRRVLDLDHLGAEVAEQLTAERAGEQLAEFDDPHIGERQRRHSVSSAGGRRRGPSSDARADSRWLRITLSAQSPSRARSAATISMW